MTGHNTICLNCGGAVTKKFCNECGQSIATHRFSLKHIFSHDLIHGLFHFDKGFFFTAKELITRPGYSIREYIEGKRVKQYNYVAFLLLLTAIYIFVLTSASKQYSLILHMKNTTIFNEVMHKYGKLSYLFEIPFSALMTMICFPRSHQNYAEHLVMNTYRTGGTLMLNIVISLFAFFIHTSQQGSILLVLITVSPFIYSIWFYNQYFKYDYPHKLERTVRIYAALALVPIAITLLVFGVLYLFFKDVAEHTIQLLIQLK